MPAATAPSRFPVIIGPTAGGKSALAVEVALAGGGEIVTADSVQIYRGLDIGSAKPTPAERRGVPHHLIDVVEPAEGFTVHDWLARAEAAIADIRSRGRLPVVVGGTHLYVKAFLEGMFDGPQADEPLRAKLRARGLPWLREELLRVDPAAAARIHPHDERRMIRALEVHLLTGQTISELQQQWDQPGRARRDCVLIGLEWPAEELGRRINARVKDMMAAGLLDEVRGLVQGGRLGVQSREALGYKQLAEHLAGLCSLDDAVERIKIDTRRFAKNQRTWLRRLHATPGSLWLDAAAMTLPEMTRRVLEACAA